MVNNLFRFSCGAVNLVPFLIVLATIKGVIGFISIIVVFIIFVVFMSVVRSAVINSEKKMVHLYRVEKGSISKKYFFISFILFIVGYKTYKVWDGQKFILIISKYPIKRGQATFKQLDKNLYVA